MLKMNNKASSILMMIFEVIAVLLVVGVTFNIATGFATSDTVRKINRAEDIKMWVNTLVSVPGDAIVENNKNFLDFQVYLKNNAVIIKSKDDPEGKIVRRSFVLPKGYTATGNIKEKKDLCLEKEGKNILLRECTKEEVEYNANTYEENNVLETEETANEPDHSDVYDYTTSEGDPIMVG